jgi:nucleoside-diphosphate-sugar epimerase
MTPPPVKYLVTGALGCIGAWVTHELVKEHQSVVALDVGSDDTRLRYLIPDGALELVERVQADITDLQALKTVIRKRDITNVIHLAALQFPFCAADPPLGAAVNVVGTVNIFEAVKGTRAALAPVVYSSSVAAYDAIDGADSDVVVAGSPGSHYGVYKLANEANARVFARDDGISSIGLRPHVVYGVGRDQGKTSDPTRAMLAAVRGEEFEIGFAGRFQMQYAPDVARAFIAASGSDHAGAAVADIGGACHDIDTVVRTLCEIVPEAAGRVAVNGDVLPFPEDLPDQTLITLLGDLSRTSLHDGIEETVTRFRKLIEAGLIAARTDLRNVVPVAGSGP